MMDLFSTVIAMAPPPGGGGQQQSPMFMPVFLGIMMLIFYFMLFRPQQRREKERKEMMANIKSGDKVVFSGGIMGIVTNVKEKVFVIKIADNVKIEVSRGAVSQVLERGDKPSE